jgi:hypothetical protein
MLPDYMGLSNHSLHQFQRLLKGINQMKRLSIETKEKIRLALKGRFISWDKVKKELDL